MIRLNLAMCVCFWLSVLINVWSRDEDRYSEMEIPAEDWRVFFMINLGVEIPQVKKKRIRKSEECVRERERERDRGETPGSGV